MMSSVDGVAPSSLATVGRKIDEQKLESLGVLVAYAGRKTGTLL